MPPVLVVHGRAYGRPASVRWSEGKLEGDRFAIMAIEDAVAAGREVGQTGGPIGPATLDVAAAGPELVVFTLAEGFDEVDRVEGLVAWRRRDTEPR